VPCADRIPPAREYCQSPVRQPLRSKVVDEASRRTPALDRARGASHRRPQSVQRHNQHVAIDVLKPAGVNHTQDGERTGWAPAAAADAQPHGHLVHAGEMLDLEAPRFWSRSRTRSRSVRSRRCRCLRGPATAANAAVASPRPRALHLILGSGTQPAAPRQPRPVARVNAERHRHRHRKQDKRKRERAQAGGHHRDPRRHDSRQCRGGGAAEAPILLPAGVVHNPLRARARARWLRRCASAASVARAGSCASTAASRSLAVWCR